MTSRSYYLDSAEKTAARALLQGSVRADVCVIGAGLAGCSTALHLAGRGYQVVVLEAESVGYGASGRSGGQVLAGVAAGNDKLEALMGRSDARRIWDVTVESLTLIRSLIDRHNIACDFVAGHMEVAIKARQEVALRNWAEQLKQQLQYPHLRTVERAELSQLIASERYRFATYDALAGHLHPLNYNLGLARAAEQAGAKIFVSSRALSYRENTQGILVQTVQGEVRAAHLVLCGNTDLGGFAPTLQRRIMPVGTYMIATEPLGAERARSLIANNAAVTDINWVLDYFRLSHDHRLLFGGRVAYGRYADRDDGRATRARMLAVFPQLRDVTVDYSWGGRVDITMNRAPDFGRLSTHVFYLQGFSGHGIALTTIAGQLLAAAIAGSAERFDVFAKIPHRPFPGGAILRRPALVLAMLWYRLRDLL